MAKKCGICIKKKNRGKFTATAKKAGQSVQAHAKTVIKKYKGKKKLTAPQKTQLKRAVFAANSKKWNRK